MKRVSRQHEATYSEVKRLLMELPFYWLNSNLIVLEASTQVDMTANRELDDTTGAITIPSGYKPIAMYAYNSNNNDNVSALPLLIRSNGRILYHAKNHSASDQGVIEFVIRVTFKRM